MVSPCSPLSFERHLYWRERAERESSSSKPPQIDSFNNIGSAPLDPQSPTAELSSPKLRSTELAEPPLEDAIKQLFELSIDEIERRLVGMDPDTKRKAIEAVKHFPLICRYNKEDLPNACATYGIPLARYHECQLETARANGRRTIGGSLSQKMRFWSVIRAEKEAKDTVVLSDSLMLIPNQKYSCDRTKRALMFTPIKFRYTKLFYEQLPPFDRKLVKRRLEVAYFDRSEQRIKIGILDDGVSYAIVYHYANIEFQLTAIVKGMVTSNTEQLSWIHTDPRHFKILIPHLDALYETLQTLLPGSREYYRHLAHVYWLAAHICRTYRGNAQYCLNFLYHEMKRVGLPLLIPKVGMMADCIALSVPLETFQEHFLNCFEPLDVVERLLTRS